MRDEDQMADTAPTREAQYTLDYLNSHRRGALGERMGITVTECTAERIVATMPVEGNTQPFGFWHGGASCVLAETLDQARAIDQQAQQILTA